jgi:hypothetical protein
MRGIERTYNVFSFLEYLRRIEKMMDPGRQYTNWVRRKTQGEIEEINLDAMERFYDYRQRHSRKHAYHSGPVPVLMRTEGKSCSFFSNDLSRLEEVKLIDPTIQPEYREVMVVAKAGTKYFIKEPAHKFRVYFKAMAVNQTQRNEVIEFVRRYQSSSVFAGPGLHSWMTAVSSWHQSFLYKHYYMDIDAESTYSLIALNLCGLIGNYYALEKRPV